MKNSKAKKILALVLAAFMVVASVASCGEKKEEEYKGADTLVVGYSNFSEKFSPFFADSAYDQDSSICSASIVKAMLSSRASKVKSVLTTAPSTLMTASRTVRSRRTPTEPLTTTSPCVTTSSSLTASR